MISVTLAFNEKHVFYEFQSMFDLKAKSVLEIGGALSYECIKHIPFKCWVSVDPLNEERSFDDRYFQEKGLASGIEAPDNHCDYIFSCDAFEHILDLQDSLVEMHRVLKNNGYLYSHFGPIWSACDGSHVENIEYGGRTYNFWESPIVPFWFHLIFEKNELEGILMTGIDRPLARKIVDFVYESPQINRMFYEDYLHAFLESHFAIELVLAINDLDYEPHFPIYDHPLAKGINPQNIRHKVQEKYGSNKKNILCRDMKIILRKISGN